MLQTVLSATLLSMFLMPATQATAQLQWSNRTSGPQPLGRSYHAMVYDAARRVTVMFGGFRGAYLGDMWTYDGTAWTQLTPSVMPAPRAQHAMAYDPVRQRVVLIGGTDGVPFTDTWEWDGAAWTEVARDVRGLAPQGAAAYAPDLGGVLFNISSTNMVWNGTAWTTLTLANPAGDQRHDIVYDPARAALYTVADNRLLRFRRSVGWEIEAYIETFGRRDYAMAYDPFGLRIVLFGGAGSLGGSSSNAMWDTQVWQGSGWRQEQTSMQGQTTRSAMVFDLQRRVFVHFGGEGYSGAYYAQTWELGDPGLPPAAYSVFGAGCRGNAASAPTLQPDPLLGARPILGGTLGLRLDGLPASQPILGLLGASRTAWGAVGLPLQLDFLGMTGCALLASPDVVLSLGASSATGSQLWLTFIPTDTALAGQFFYQQVAVLARGANPAGLLWSNGGEGMFGGR